MKILEFEIKEKKIHQGQLAKFLKCSAVHLSNTIRGEVQSLDEERVEKIAKFIKIPISRFASPHPTQPGRFYLLDLEVK